MNKLKMLINMEGIEGAPQAEGQPKLTPQEVVANVTKNIMFSYARNTNGLNGEERKQYYRITAALDEAVKSKLEVIELEDQDAGFLKKCKRESKMMPSDALQMIEELIETMVKL